MGGGSAWGSAITSISAGLQAVVGNRDLRSAQRSQSEGVVRADQTRADQYSKTVDYLDEYRNAGTPALKRLSELTSKPFEYDVYKDPGTQFRMKAGLDAINRSAAAKGGALSGGTLKALTQYGQEMASTEYGNAFNRYLADVGNLQGMAGLGFNAASQLAGYSDKFGDNRAEAQTDLANVEAGGRIARYRNWQNLDSQAAGAWSSFFGTGQQGQTNKDWSMGYGSSTSKG